MTYLTEVLLLAIWSAACIYDWFGTKLIWALRPLIAGFGAGLIVGDVTLGMAVGATLELASLGMYSYGGVSVPDFSTGTIVATGVGVSVAGATPEQAGLGVIVGLPVAIVMIWLDSGAKKLTVFSAHAADRFALAGRSRGLTVMHFSAFAVHGAARGLPTFVVLSVIRPNLVTTVQRYIPAELVHGMELFLAILPALGFGLLLTQLPLKKYWYLFLLGFVSFAYLRVAIIGLVLIAVVASAMYAVVLGPVTSNAEESRDGPSR